MQRIKRKVKRKIAMALLPWLLGIVFIGGLFLALVGTVIVPASHAASDSNSGLSGNAAAIAAAIRNEDPKATNTGIAAILGVWQVESGNNSQNYETASLHKNSWSDVVAANFDPTVLYGSWSAFQALYPKLHLDQSSYYAPDSGQYVLGIGAGQLTGPRGYKLITYAKDNGEDIGAAQTQINFISSEDSRASTFKNVAEWSDSLESGVNEFAEKWEGSRSDESEGYQNAKNFLDQMSKPASTGGGSGKTYNAIPPGYAVDDPKPDTGTFNGDPYPWGQCTWYVWGRAQQYGISYSLTMGNGNQWMNASGYTVTQTPTRHAAVSFASGQAGADSTYGHVAFVEDVKEDGSILISEANAAGGLGVVDYRTFSASDAKQFHYVIGK